MVCPLALTPYANALLCGGALALACSALSVVVVLRRWAFIGEGISHAGFGGLGTAWLLSLAVPAVGTPAAAYAVAVVFCLAVALSIGYVSRADGGTGRDAPSPDVVIGIFLAASLAWGFLALALYQKHAGPAAAGAADWERYLFGSISDVSDATLSAGVAVSAAVLLVLGALWKEIVYYAFDPLLARIGGVRTGVIHYLLMVLLALVIVIGMRIAGNVLMTALLVLPGATALRLGRRLGRVLVVSAGVALVGSVGGLVLTRHALSGLPAGPAIVLMLFAQYAAAYAGTRLVRGRARG